MQYIFTRNYHEEKTSRIRRQLFRGKSHIVAFFILLIVYSCFYNIANTTLLRRDFKRHSKTRTN